MLNFFYKIGELINIKMLNKAEVYNREYFFSLFIPSKSG